MRLPDYGWKAGFISPCAAEDLSVWVKVIKNVYDDWEKEKETQK